MYTLIFTERDWRTNTEWISAGSEDEAVHIAQDRLRETGLNVVELLDRDYYGIARVFADGTVKDAI